MINQSIHKIKGCCGNLKRDCLGDCEDYKLCLSIKEDYLNSKYCYTPKWLE